MAHAIIRRPMRDETKARIAAALKGVPKSDEARRNMSAATRVITDDNRKRQSRLAHEIGLRNRGKKRTEIDRLLGQISRKEEALRGTLSDVKCAGVSAEQGRWRVRHMIDGKRIEIGSFDDFGPAKAAYIAVVTEHLTVLRSKLESLKSHDVR